MKMRFTTLALGLALSFATSSHAQHVATVISSNLFEPNAIATDGNNNVFITDTSNHRIMKFAPTTGQMSVLAGSIGKSGTNNGTASSARFNQPGGIVAARGGVIVADTWNHMLRFVTTNGVVTTLAGVPGSYGGYVDSPGVPQFSYPLGLAADTNGNVYVADSGNNAIRVLAPDNTVSTYATGLYQPSAVAVGDNGDLWVANTRDHTIVRVKTDHTWDVIAGTSGDFGSTDAPDDSLSAQFNLPSGLMWVDNNAGLLISDTGNNTIRRLYFNNDPAVMGYAVQTVAGLSGSAGFVDGSPASAKFFSPVGIASDPVDSGFYVVDRENNAVRSLQLSAPQPPVPDPIVGFVTFELNPQNNTYGSKFHPATQAVFNNPAIIAIEGQFGTQTFITYGVTPPNSFSDTIPAPNAQTGVSPTLYRGDGLFPEETAQTIVPIMPDITIKSVGMEDGRRPSNIVTNRFQFKVANPSYSGDNAASFYFDDITTNALLYYTINGSDPSATNAAGFGPVTSGQVISIGITNDTVIKARAFLPNFTPSEIISKTFSVSNFNANKLSFGFQAGEGSSDFVAAPGQRFYAPVTLSLLQGATMYSLQFNATVTNLNGAPSVAPGAYGFQTMLKKPLEGITPPIYVPIPPAMFLGTNDNLFQSMLITNNSENLVGVGWFERYGKTNLYNTKSQDLLRYSMAHNTMFLSANRQVIVGGYSFVVPSDAALGQQYEIQLGRPSGTSDGIAQPVYIAAPTNGTPGPGSINAIKHVTVGSRAYLVGDSVPFRWFNAGDFGDTNLNNADVMDLFQGVVYDLNRPPEGSDFFDCMDSSDGSAGSAALDGNDTIINTITNGDGVLGVDDIYVTFRRSLDPSLTWWTRYWSNGVRMATAIPNVIANGQQPVTQQQSVTPHIASGPRFVNVAPDDASAAPSATIQIPVRASIVGNLPLRVMAMNIDVQPLDGSPAVTVPVSFNPAAGLGSPTLSSSIDPGNFAGAWLNSTIAGVSGTNVLGVLTVTLPTNATSSSAWIVHFSHLSVSPNGVGLFPLTKQDALITTANRSGSSWGDGIPDSWRLRWFGSVSNLLSGANLDPDGDGHSNYAEYIAGTNPLDGISSLNVNCQGGAPRSALTWPSVFGKQYSVECSSTLFGGSWSVIGTNLSGNGQLMQFADPNPTSSMRFYRVKVQ